MHFIGIGGAGMSVVAELFLARGLEVSGSDAKDSEVLSRLRARGAVIGVGHDAAAVAGATTVVVSSAIREDNPELATARAAGMEVIHRSVALARAAEGLDFVAVAGAHGKTTTTGMLAAALTAAGLDPSYAIGGSLIGGAGAHLGGGTVLVAEADESDSSFLNYAPQIAVVTNVEADHLDRYGTTAAVEAAFESFLDRIRPGGLLVACADDAGSARIADIATSRGIRVRRYGALADAHLRDAGWTVPDEAAEGMPRVLIDDVDQRPDGSTATLRIGSTAVALRLRVPGLHNVLNAAAAWCVGLELGVGAQAMADALGAFTGTARRFELRGQVAGVRVIDDYSHHPTEVSELLKTARNVAGEGRVVVLFQPHLYSRTEAFATAFAAALSQADAVVLTAIYGAREDPRPGVTSELITERGSGYRYVPDRVDAARAVAALARPGDLVLTVGAGDVTELADVILAELGEKR